MVSQLKQIQELKKAYINTYNKYAENFNDFSKKFEELNKQMVELSTQSSEILTFMESAIKAKELLEKEE